MDIFNEQIKHLETLTALPRKIMVLITFGTPVFSCKSSTENNCSSGTPYALAASMKA